MLVCTIAAKTASTVTSRCASSPPVIEAVMAVDLGFAGMTDPDITGQTISPRRELGELGNIRLHRLSAGRHIELVDRPTALQHKILDAFDVDTNAWSRAKIS